MSCGAWEGINAPSVVATQHSVGNDRRFAHEAAGVEPRDAEKRLCVLPVEARTGKEESK